MEPFDPELSFQVSRVERSWDEKAGPTRTKSKAGRRTVPIVAALRTYLIEHRFRTGRPSGLVFGRTATDPFTPSNVRKRSLTAWKHVNPIGLHEARHTYASLLIAAGVNVKAISNYMGHSSVTITLDRYGHLMPGHEAEAVAKIDAYLAL